MADRRMIHRDIITSDEYIDLSFQAQGLYIQFVIEADNFGFVGGVKRIMRSIGVNEEHLNELERARFVIRFDSGIFVVRHWFVMNYGGEFSKNDRTITTNCFDELSSLTVDTTGAYLRRDSNGFQQDSNGFHTEHQKSQGQYSQIQNKVIQYIRNAIKCKVNEAEGGEKDDDVRGAGKTTTTPPAPHQPDWIDSFEKGCGNWIPGENVIQSIRRYVQYGMSPDLILFARDQTIRNGANNEDHYFVKVLSDYYQSGFRTAADAKKRENERTK